MRATLAFVVFGLIAQAAYADREFGGLSSSARHTCQGAESVLVSGVGLRITLTGVCGKLHVSGANNAISVEVVASIDIDGTNNRISYSKGAPRLSNSGSGNIIEPETHDFPIQLHEQLEAITERNTPAALALKVDQCNATQTIQGAAIDQTVKCSSGERLLIEGHDTITRVIGNCVAVCISGDKNVISVEGDALAVAISGSDNQLRANRVDSVSVEGRQNAIRFQSSLGGEGPNNDQPKLASAGAGNSVSRK